MLEQAVCHAFHWVNVSKLPEIENGSEVLESDTGQSIRKEPGLWPTSKVVVFDWQKFEPVTKGPYMFCFINSSYPPEWQKYPELYRALLELKIGYPRVLISFDVYASDEPRVLGNMPTEGGYCRLEVPFSEYRGNLDRPELLIPNHISLSRLNFEFLPVSL